MEKGIINWKTQYNTQYYESIFLWDLEENQFIVNHVCNNCHTQRIRDKKAYQFWRSSETSEPKISGYTRTQEKHIKGILKTTDIMFLLHFNI